MVVAPTLRCSWVVKLAMRTLSRLSLLVAVLAVAGVASAAPGVRGGSGGKSRAEHRRLRNMTAGAKVRPDSFFSRGNRLLIDASHVKRVAYKGLQLVPLKEVFSRPTSTFIGFGSPNTYLVVPRKAGDPKGRGWNTLTAFMFWRKASYVADTKGRVQGGLFVEMRGLPGDARDALRKAMERESGTCRASCANTTARVLASAGFELRNGADLSKILLPSTLARDVWEHGLRFKGKDVNLRFVATYPGTTQEHFATVIKKQATAPFRAVKKIFDKSKKRAPLIRPRLLAPVVVRVSKAAPKVNLRMGRPSKLAAALRQVWGEHPLYEARPDKATADMDSAEFSGLHTPLKAFAGKPNLYEKFKLRVVGGGGWLRKQLARPLRERGKVVDSESLGDTAGEVAVGTMRVGEKGKPFRYNLVMTGDGVRWIRLKNGSAKDSKAADWVLTKHLILAGASKDIRFAGEIWVEDTPKGRVVHINNDSGTFQPDRARTVAAARYLQKALGVKVVAHDRDGRVLRL